MHSEKKSIVIGVNLISVPLQKAGVGFLAVNLMRELIPRQSQHRFILYSSKDNDFSELKFANSTQKKLAPVSPIKKIFWEQFIFRGIVKADQPDILLNFHYTALLMLSAKIRQVTVVPDMTYQRYFFKRKIIKSLYITCLLPFSLLKSISIIAISEFTKQEILKFFPVVNPDKITVMHLGLGSTEEKNIPGEADESPVKMNLIENRYFLFVGTVEPTKNLFRNLQAFKEVHRKFPEVKFFVVGKRGWQDKQDKQFIKLEEYIKKFRLDEAVIFTGYLNNISLKKLYENAVALIFTSLYEGFGLPLLEAMSAGTPVLSSKISSIPEVAGEAALLVDPFSVADIKAGMLRLLENEDYRESLIEKGRKRLKAFNWSKSAAIVENIILPDKPALTKEQN